MRCVDCGCSHYEPCLDVVAGGPCCWVLEDPPLCSACAFERGVVLGVVPPQPSFACVPVVEIEPPRILTGQ